MSQQIPSGVQQIPLQYATPMPRTPGVRAVGLAQRRIMWVILGALLLGVSLVMGSSIQAAFRGSQVSLIVVLALLVVLRLALVVLMMIGVYQLATALGSNMTTRVLYVIAMIIPYINLIVLLVVNQRATNLLKRNGIKVGLMGARIADLPAM